MSLTACTGTDSSVVPIHRTAASVAVRPPRDRQALSGAVINAQRASLQQRRDRQFAATWAGRPNARRQAANIATNLRRLGGSVVDMRAIPATTNPAPPSAATSGGTWSTQVDVTWWAPEMGTGTVVSPLTYTFVSAKGRARVAGVRARTGSRQPIWLVGRIRVERRLHLVAVADSAPAAHQLASRLQVARHDVSRFMTDWHGSLTAYLPGSTGDFEGILAARPRQYASVAAVTTTVDGSTDAHAPMVIVLNPEIWPRLRSAGAHVVVTHEAVHAVSGSVTATLPDWVSEGFADYVAVRSAGVPFRVSSAEAVADLQKHGVPRRLPRDAAFEGTGPNVEATYELSRLLMVTIARHHGQAQLRSFYTDMVAHPADLEGALRRELRTSRAQLTRQWSHLLVRLAGAQ